MATTPKPKSRFTKGSSGNPSTQFKKGRSGNPKGRPPKLPKLDELLAEVLGDEKDDITAAKGILMALRKKAIAGDVRAAEILLDRAYGKAKQTIKHEGDPEAPIIIDWSGGGSKKNSTNGKTA
jgi:Family of unknown function (DUF5681)